MMDKLSILIVGVGGQGSLLASRILGALFLQNGRDVKVSEVHGMSQRGGSVVTHVRAGQSVASPLVSKGEADLIIAFEQLEALRWADYIKPTGTIISSTQKISPMPVITGAAQYPDGIFAHLSSFGIKTVTVDALKIATGLHNVKTANVVMLGAASNFLPYGEDAWIAALKEQVKERFYDINLQAFLQGRTCMQTQKV